VSFADWTWHKSDADLIAAIDGSTPMVGAGLLRLSNAANTSPARRVHGFYTSNNGFTHGRARTLIQVAASTNRMRAGLYCCASQANLTTAGACYYAALENDTGGPGRRIRLWKTAANGLDENSNIATALVTVSHPAFTTGTTKALELEWYASAEILGGTRLIVRVGDQAEARFDSTRIVPLF
jgi:hypothetical protein